MEFEGERLFTYKSIDSLSYLNKHLKKFGFIFHDFRRTFGIRWSKQLRPFELKKIMKHKELRTTDKYYVQSDTDEVRAKMDGCYLVAKSNKKSEKLYKIAFQQEK